MADKILQLEKIAYKDQPTEEELQIELPGLFIFLPEENFRTWQNKHS